MNETEYEFRKGDRVRAKQNSPYNITSGGWVGYVVRSRNRYGLIQVWHTATGQPGYAVQPQYFELIDEDGNSVTPEPPEPLADISDSELDAFMKEGAG